jgi:hypothetical protein
LFEFSANDVQRFYVILERFLHFFVNRHDLIDRVALFFLVLVNDFELDLVESFSVVDNVFVGFV